MRFLVFLSFLAISPMIFGSNNHFTVTDGSSSTAWDNHQKHLIKDYRSLRNPDMSQKKQDATWTTSDDAQLIAQLMNSPRESAPPLNPQQGLYSQQEHWWLRNRTGRN
jgi:hypothetical protein